MSGFVEGSDMLGGIGGRVCFELSVQRRTMKGIRQGKGSMRGVQHVGDAGAVDIYFVGPYHNKEKNRFSGRK